MRRTYPYDQVQTPCERLRGLDCAERNLKPDVTLELAVLLPRRGGWAQRRACEIAYGV